MVKHDKEKLVPIWFILIIISFCLSISCIIYEILDWILIAEWFGVINLASLSRRIDIRNILSLGGLIDGDILLIPILGSIVIGLVSLGVTYIAKKLIPIDKKKYQSMTTKISLIFAIIASILPCITIFSSIVFLGMFFL